MAARGARAAGRADAADRRASAPWAIVGVKIVRWVRLWDEKHQPIIILINFLVLDRARLRCVKLGLLRGEGFADENLVHTVPQRMSLIFEHRKISTERFTCSTDFRLNFVLCIECCDSSSIYLSQLEALPAGPKLTFLPCRGAAVELNAPGGHYSAATNQEQYGSVAFGSEIDGGV